MLSRIITRMNRARHACYFAGWPGWLLERERERRLFVHINLKRGTSKDAKRIRRCSSRRLQSIMVIPGQFLGTRGGGWVSTAIKLASRQLEAANWTRNVMLSAWHRNNYSQQSARLSKCQASSVVTVSAMSWSMDSKQTGRLYDGGQLVL